MGVDGIQPTTSKAVWTFKHESFPSDKSRAAELKKKEDKIEISGEARSLLRQLFLSERQVRVEALKEQVSAGTYSVDSRLIAEKLLARLLKE